MEIKELISKARKIAENSGLNVKYLSLECVEQKNSERKNDDFFVYIFCTFSIYKNITDSVTARCRYYEFEANDFDEAIENSLKNFKKECRKKALEISEMPK